MESLKLQFMQELSPALKSGCTELVLLNAIETLVGIIGKAKWKGKTGGEEVGDGVMRKHMEKAARENSVHGVTDLMCRVSMRSVRPPPLGQVQRPLRRLLSTAHPSRRQR